MKLFPRRHAVHVNVALLCLLCIASLWAVLLQQLDIEHSGIVANQHRNNGNLAMVFEAHVARTIRSAESTLRDVATAYQREGARYDLVRHMQDHGDHLDPFTLVSILNEKGDVVRLSAPASGPLNFSHNENFRFHRQNDTPRLYISAPRRGVVTNRWTIYLSMRLNKADGSFGGLVAVGMNPGYFANIYNELDLGPDAVVSLLGRDGAVLARNVGEGEGIGVEVIDPKRLTALLAGASQGSFMMPGPLDQVPRFYSYRALNDFPLVVLVGTSQAAALLNHERNSARYRLGATIASVVILLFGVSIMWQIRRAARWREAQHHKDVAAADLLRSTTQGMRTAQRIAKLGSWERNQTMGELVWSDEMFRIFELDGQQAVSSFGAFLEVVHPDDRAMVARAYTESLGKPLPHELTHRLCMRDGRVKWVQERWASDFDADGTLLRSMGTVQDITERKSIQLKLVESEARLSNIVAREPECIKILDAGGRLRLMNPAGLAMIEADALEQVEGLRVLDVIAPEFHAAFEEMHRQVLAGKAVQLEFKVVGLKGRHRWVETHAVPLQEGGETVHLAVTRDITERKRTEEQLRVAAATFESQEAMLITDANEVILQVNWAFTKITGYSATEVVGRTPRLLQSGRHGKDFYRHMWDTIQRVGSWQGEIWDKHKNGEVHPKWLTISAVKGRDGAVTHYIGSHIDITERKLAEQAMLDLNHELTLSRQNLRKLVAQNEAMLESERKHIAREVHDELGQVLSALRMDLSLLSMRFGSNDPDLNKRVLAMKTLVDRAILGVRNVAANLRPTALDMGLIPAIEWLCQEFMQHAGVECALHVEDDNIALNDERAVVVFRIVQESLTNVGRYAQASQVHITLSQHGNELKVVVRDNGRGFDLAAAAGRKSFGLLGMRERAIALGGHVDIASAADQGTVISVLIPVDHDIATRVTT